MSEPRRERGTGGVNYEPSRDRWVGTVHLGTDARGRRINRRVTARTKTEAIKKLRSLREESGHGAPTAHGSMTVAELLDRWLATAAPNRVTNRSTLDNYRQMCALVREQIGTVKLAQLEPDDIERLLVHLAADGYPKTTLQRVRGLLGQAVRWAVKRRYAAWDPTAVAELSPDSAISSSRTRISKSLTPSEAERLAAAAMTSRNGIGLILAMTLGLRPSELTALTWAHLDVEKLTLTISQAWKDSGEHRRVGDPKTRRSVRTVGVPPVLMPALSEHRRRQLEESVALGWRNELGLMFVSETGTPLDPANLRRTVRGVAQSAGLDHVTPYQLRHSGASLLVDAGVSIERVREPSRSCRQPHHRAVLQPSSATVDRHGRRADGRSARRHSQKIVRMTARMMPPTTTTATP
jgi:integrase